MAGMAALVRAKFPTMDAANVINRLIKTAKPVGRETPERSVRLRHPERRQGADRAHPDRLAEPAGLARPLGRWIVRAVDIAVNIAARVDAAGRSHTAAAPTARGSGAGTWIAVAALGLVIAALVAWFVARSRRTTGRR